jgi:hypothetical protein
MGIKTTINNKGVFSESVQGNDQLVVNVRQRQSVQVVSASGNATVGSHPIAVFEASGNAVTASLPTISDGNIGLRLTCINNHADNALVLSGATGQPINGGALELEVSGTSGYQRGQDVVAVSSSFEGYGWYTV